ncbi:MAG TPA: hypothetical protein PLE77_06025 [Kiritimatiellia bacterium]|nr:hypothetical protein [Kiritimatiellia bacterium]
MARNKGIEDSEAKLKSRHMGGATWFYWIAALSLINSVVILMGSEWSFIIGLGVTQFVDGVAANVAQQAGAEAAPIIKATAFAVDFVIAAFFVVFGIFAVKRQAWAYIMGMVLYAMDALLFLLVGDMLSIAFHAFALACIFNGLLASLKMDKAGAVAQPPAPPALPA